MKLEFHSLSLVHEAATGKVSNEITVSHRYVWLSKGAACRNTEAEVYIIGTLHERLAGIVGGARVVEVEDRWMSETHHHGWQPTS